MKKVFFAVVILMNVLVFSSCESESLDNETTLEDLELTVSAIDKEDAETVGTRD